MNINYGCQKQKNHGHGARAILQINKFDVDTFAIMAKEAVSLVGEVCTLGTAAGNTATYHGTLLIVKSEKCFYDWQM